MAKLVIKAWTNGLSSNNGTVKPVSVKHIMQAINEGKFDDYLYDEKWRIFKNNKGEPCNDLMIPFDRVYEVIGDYGYPEYKERKDFEKNLSTDNFDFALINIPDYVPCNSKMYREDIITNMPIRKQPMILSGKTPPDKIMQAVQDYTQYVLERKENKEFEKDFEDDFDDWIKKKRLENL